ncbi:MAG: Rrf2 family transcriptional regulator [Candidatus Omnitrophica bacterium]|nr:Rrf2 family transcriptional regulator [Candidatus Omnitrophota bacterium]
MLTKKAKYALTAILNLARKHEDAPTRISELAQEENIPQKFLEAILLELKKHGFLHSKKGKGGGYMLRKSPEEISMGDIIRAIDGPLAPVPCVSQSAYQKCSECKDERTCGIRITMKDVRDAMADVLDNTTIADVLRRVEEAEKAKQIELVKIS